MSNQVDHEAAKQAAEAFGEHAIEFVTYRTNITVRCLIGFLVTDTDGYIVLEPRYDTNEEIHIPLKDVVARIPLSHAYLDLSEENDALRKQVEALERRAEMAERIAVWQITASYPEKKFNQLVECIKEAFPSETQDWGGKYAAVLAILDHLAELEEGTDG